MTARGGDGPIVAAAAGPAMRAAPSAVAGGGPPASAERSVDRVAEPPPSGSPAVDPLFTPIDVGGLRLRNRIVVPPMGTGLDDHGTMNDATVAYYRRRAAGGAAAVTVEALLVDPDTDGPEPRVDRDEHVPGLRRVADGIRAEGAIAGAQLLHPGRQVFKGRCCGPSAVPINSASPVPDPLTVAEVEAIVVRFADAAERIRDAGYDFVEIHGAHGYLPSDFLSPLANRRDDHYGGDLEGRARFLREIARAIRERCPDLPLWVRIGGEEALPGGTTIDDAVALAGWLEEDGASCISVTSGHWRSLEVTLAPMWMPRAHLVGHAARIRAAVTVPVMAVGRLDRPEDARAALLDGSADLIAIGRGLIAEPDWPRKVEEGRDDEVRPCIACNACVDLVGPGGEIRCAVNPTVGRDERWDPRPADPPRHVAVVGAGPAGLEAALVARARGHRVTLWEREDRIGGKIVAAASAPSKHEVLRFRDFEERELDRLGVEVHTGVEVTPDVLATAAPDVVVLASGAAALVPPIAGLGLPHVHDAQEHLRGDHAVAPGASVVVIGGSATGCETAELLVDRGARVTIVEMAPAIGAGIEAITRRHIIRQLRRHGAEILTGARVTGVTDDAVVYERDGVEHRVAADHVALAIGWRSRGRELADLLPDVEVHVIGDAERPADFVAAVNAGADVGSAV